MHHFLCEGAEGKSEYTFVQAIIKEFNKSNEPYILRSSNGNRGILRTFNEMYLDFKNGDTFILFFDSVETICGSLVSDILHGISKKCSDINVNFRYTTYYCFEELFLSYPCFLDIVNVSEEFLRELEKVQSMLLNKQNYYREDLSFWNSYFKDQSGALKTRECLSASICSCASKTAKGHFLINKNSIGVCWISDCGEAKINENVCKQCRYSLKDCTFREKLTSIDSTSVSKFSLPFSTIFD